MRKRSCTLRYIASIDRRGAVRRSAPISFDGTSIMKRSAFACALLLGVSWLPSSPDARAADIALRGAASCALWTKGRAQNDANYEKAWLTGYFSGLAIGFDTNFWGIRGKDELDSEAVWKWMDDYCTANPKNSLIKGAEKLFLERMRRPDK
jgi:hypothetical protein